MFKHVLQIVIITTAFGSMQAMSILHPLDTAFLGEPQHRVTVLEGNYHTVYAAYPKKVLSAVSQRKLLSQSAATLCSASFLYLGLQTISNTFTNSWRSVSATSTSYHVSGYVLLTALAYALEKLSWNSYDHATQLLGRFNSFPVDNQEISNINAANPNLVWMRESHAVSPPPAYESRVPAPSPYPLQASAPPYPIQASAPPYPIQASAPMFAQDIRPQALNCSICNQPINKNMPLSNMALPCLHLFHEACVRPVIAETHACPECKVRIQQQ